MGDSRTPLIFLIFSSLLNIFLDIFLIVVIPLGTAGAAYATVISQGLSALLCFLYMFRKFDILRTTRKDYYFDRTGVKSLLSIGVPMALNYSITALGLIVIQSAVNVFGSTVVAAYTAAAKVFQLIMQIPASLGTTLSTFCGQNLGAAKYSRIFQGVRCAFLLSFAIVVIAALICVLGGPYAIRLFIADPSPETVGYAMHYLTLISWFLPFLVWIFIYRCSLQGLDKGMVPMLTGFVELFVRYLVITCFAQRFGYTAVCLADPVTWVATAIPLMAAYYHWKHHITKQMAAT